jgi:hypothetical protein
VSIDLPVHAEPPPLEMAQHDPAARSAEVAVH